MAIDRFSSRIITITDYCPYLTYTWRKKQINEWFDKYDCGGGKTWYNGGLFQIKAKHIACGNYAVSFIKLN